MKKKIFFGSMITVGFAAIILVACSKSTPPNSVGDTSQKSSTVNDPSVYQRSANEVTSYYSVDSETGENYKLKVTTNPDGSVEINRKPTGNHEGQNISNFNLIETGIEYTQTADAVTIVVPEGRTYYYIPFNPTLPTSKLIAGGSITFRCVCGVPSTSIGCRVAGSGGPGGTVFTCLNELCTDCKLTGSAPGPTARVTSGFILIDATSLTEN